MPDEDEEGFVLSEIEDDEDYEEEEEEEELEDEEHVSTFTPQSLIQRI